MFEEVTVPPRPSFALAALALIAGCASTSAERARSAADPTLPSGVEQLLPRGKIPAIDRPTLLPASRAEIGDDAWVLGVVVDGQARAYSLNLLNSHEVVNDRIGQVAFAAVW